MSLIPDHPDRPGRDTGIGHHETGPEGGTAR
jgi:hypothetical protein